ncbi:MAG: pyridoxamine 5'-phosphate oxidase family protein [Fidelibacterota bacterium]
MNESQPLKMRRKDRQVTAPEAIHAIIQRADVCRIALARDNLPYIVALNFGFRPGHPSRFYFHCARTGRKLDFMAYNNYVCFQLDVDHRFVPADSACDHTMTFQSVLGYGFLIQVDDPAERQAGLNCIMRHYTEREDWDFSLSMLKHTTVLRLDVESMTAKRKDE